MEANYLDAYYNDSKSMDMDTAEKNFRDTETLSKSEGSVKASGGETSTLLSYINIDKDGWVLFVSQIKPQKFKQQTAGESQAHCAKVRALKLAS